MKNEWIWKNESAFYSGVFSDVYVPKKSNKNQL